MAKREWVIRRSCFMSPRQLVLAYAALRTLSLAVAVFFTLHGAWYVLAFSILEISAVGCAFVHFGQYSNDGKRILPMDNYLAGELAQVKSRAMQGNPHVSREAPPDRPAHPAALDANGIEVEAGRFLKEWRRRELEWESKSALAS